MHLASKRVGFLGAGNMARAIAAGLIGKGIVPVENILASDVSEPQRKEFRHLTGASVTPSNAEVMQRCDVVVFAVKPFHVAAVCEEIRSCVKPRHLFVSICAGIPTEFYESRLGADVRVVRVMPNTPALIGAGATAVARGKFASPEDVATVLELFRAVGVAVELPEDKLDLVTGLSGSGPAYVFFFAEAMIEAAVKLGLEQSAAEFLVKQTLYGASRLALESQKSLRDLRDAVTTKGGTTEAGLRSLESRDFVNVIYECIAAATRRSAELARSHD